MLDTYVATSTAFAGDVAAAFFGGFFDLMYEIMPYAIGILFVYIGIAWARRSLGGR